MEKEEEEKLLAKQGELLTKKEEGQNLEANEEEELNKIEKTLKEEGTSKKTEEEQIKMNKSALAQKEHFRSKFQKADEELQKIKKELEESKSKKASPLDDKEWKENMEFLTLHRDVDPKFTEEVRAYARGRSISLEDAYKSDTIQSAYKALQEKSRKEEKIPEPSSRSMEVEGKKVSEMSREEKKKNYSSLVDKVISEKNKPHYR